MKQAGGWRDLACLAVGHKYRSRWRGIWSPTTCLRCGRRRRWRGGPLYLAIVAAAGVMSICQARISALTHDNGGYDHRPSPGAKRIASDLTTPPATTSPSRGQAQEREAPMHRRIVVVCGIALAVFAVLSVPASATEQWQSCPTPRMAGFLRVQVAGCPEGRAVVERYATKAQYRGPRIRVYGFRCYAVRGYSPIRCRRGKKHVEYVGSF